MWVKGLTALSYFPDHKAQDEAFTAAKSLDRCDKLQRERRCIKPRMMKS
jgi:hypothetical protein